jgi:hypothetical protein
MMTTRSRAGCAASASSNATNQPITVAVPGARPAERSVGPDETVDGLTTNDTTLLVDLPSCGDAMLQLRNPILIGKPEVGLFSGGRSILRSVGEGEATRFDTDAVKLRVERRDDSRSYQEFAVDVTGCTAPEADGDDDTADDDDDGAPGMTRRVRATLRNATDDRLTLTVLHTTSLDPIRRFTLKPGQSRRNVTVDEDELFIDLPCGDVMLNFDNPTIGRPSAGLYFDELLGGSSRSLDEQEVTTFDRRGVKVRVTRRDDTRASKNFTAELLRCAPDA